MNTVKLQWWHTVVNKKNTIEVQLNNNIDLPLDQVIALQKELAEIEPLIGIAEQIYRANEDIEFLKLILNEDGLNNKNEIEEQIQGLEGSIRRAEQEFSLLNRQELNKTSKVILEIRPGAGGQEASLFAALLVEMYKKYAQNNNWIWDILSLDYNEIGGLEGISASIEGGGAFQLMQHESGVHRIQRIPKTESNGRIHTSTATVAVLIEPDEANVQIDENYMRIDVFRASGAGGQHVNKTESAIRLTYNHPDLEKIVISIQDERSQHKNKAKAMKILRAKVQNQIEAKLNQEVAQSRKSQVGTGDRSEKIRTYNFPQSRVTDHRSGVSVYNIQDDILLLPKDLLIIVNPLQDNEID